MPRTLVVRGITAFTGMLTRSPSSVVLAGSVLQKVFAFGEFFYALFMFFCCRLSRIVIR